MKTNHFSNRQFFKIPALIWLVAAGLFISGSLAQAGAIFTTDAGCQKINGNIYAMKGDVYLNGGPDGTGSSLAPGTYCVWVTEPNQDTVLGGPGTVVVGTDGKIQCTRLT